MAVYPYFASQGRAEDYILSIMEAVWADGLDLAVDAATVLLPGSVLAGTGVEASA
jgi:hypothetical protein